MDGRARAKMRIGNHGSQFKKITSSQIENEPHPTWSIAVKTFCLGKIYSKQIQKKNEASGSIVIAKGQRVSSISKVQTLFPIFHCWTGSSLPLQQSLHKIGFIFQDYQYLFFNLVCLWWINVTEYIPLLLRWRYSTK